MIERSSTNNTSVTSYRGQNSSYSKHSRQNSRRHEVEAVAVVVGGGGGVCGRPRQDEGREGAPAQQAHHRGYHQLEAEPAQQHFRRFVRRQ